MLSVVTRDACSGLDRIYHLALRDEWLDAVDSDGTYRRSTLGRSLEEEGFIHCSFAQQVQGIADLVYRGRSDVVLLVVNRAALQAEVRVENCGTSGDAYPHVYGPLPVDAVVDSIDVPVGPDGRLGAEALIGGGRAPGA